VSRTDTTVLDREVRRGAWTARPVLVALALPVTAAGCTTLVGLPDVPGLGDAGTSDGGRSDGARRDGATRDSARADSAVGDSSRRDSTTQDSGPPDAPRADGGHEAGATDAGEAGEAGACTSGAASCSGSSVIVCGASGQWGAPTPCGGSTPACSGGRCVSVAASSCPAPDAGLASCGASRESCCMSLKVAGGGFYRTYANDGGGASSEADPATLSTLRLDRYLVTVGRFRQFVKAWNHGAGYTPDVGSGKHAHLNGGQGLVDVSGGGGGYETGWAAGGDSSLAPTDANLACDPVNATGTWTPSPAGQEELPINCVNWYEAYAFCIWDGGFLPSEAEWEYAAAGGAAQREYPWGSTAPGTANDLAIYGCLYPSGASGCSSPSLAMLAPVGTAAAGEGLFGQLDLAGELLEWTLDTSGPFVDPCVDCANLGAGQYRSTRGGAWDDSTSYLLPTDREQGGPTQRDRGIGFRCARTP